MKITQVDCPAIKAHSKIVCGRPKFAQCPPMPYKKITYCSTSHHTSIWSLSYLHSFHHHAIYILSPLVRREVSLVIHSNHKKILTAVIMSKNYTVHRHFTLCLQKLDHTTFSNDSNKSGQLSTDSRPSFLLVAIRAETNAT